MPVCLWLYRVLSCSCGHRHRKNRTPIICRCAQGVATPANPCTHQRTAKKQHTTNVWCNGIECRIIGDSLPIPVQWIRVARHHAYTKGRKKVCTHNVGRECGCVVFSPAQTITDREALDLWLGDVESLMTTINNVSC